MVVQYLVHLPMARARRHDGHMVRAEEVLQPDFFLIQPVAFAKSLSRVIASLRRVSFSTAAMKSLTLTWVGLVLVSAIVSLILPSFAAL